MKIEGKKVTSSRREGLRWLLEGLPARKYGDKIQESDSQTVGVTATLIFLLGTTHAADIPMSGLFGIRDSGRIVFKLRRYYPAGIVAVGHLSKVYILTRRILGEDIGIDRGGIGNIHFVPAYMATGSVNMSATRFSATRYPHIARASTSRPSITSIFKTDDLGEYCLVNSL